MGECVCSNNFRALPNGDGRKECIFTTSNANRSYLYILDSTLAPVEKWDLNTRYSIPTGDRFTRISVADYDQDGKDEQCFINGANADIGAGYHILDDMDANFAVLGKGTVNNGSAKIALGNVAAADFTGDGLPDTVFYGRKDASGNGANGQNNLLLLKTTLDDNFTPAFTFHGNYTSNGIISNAALPNLAAGDVDEDGKAEVFAANKLYTFNGSNFVTLSGTGTEWIFANPVSATPIWDMYDVTIGDVTGDGKGDMVQFMGWGQLQIFYYSTGQYRRSNNQIAGGSGHETGCLPNVDDDSFVLRDTGDRELLFTDPQVIAVLASPPYYSGISQEGDGGTSFGYSKSSGSTESNSADFSVGFSLGLEYEAPFNIAKFEFEYSVKQSFGWTQSTSMELSESWGWNTPIAQDLVIFTAIPFDVYYYEVPVAPPGDNGKAGDIITVNVPRKPQHVHVPLSMFNASVAEEQRITVNHSLGVPASYFTKTQRDEQKTQAGSKGLFSTNTQLSAGAGIGNTTINIENITGTEDSFAFEQETEISFKVGAGGVTAGVSSGFSYGYETTSSVSNGTWIEGTVPAIPQGNYGIDRDFNWGLMAYPRKDANQNYIFVTYWVDHH